VDETRIELNDIGAAVELCSRQNAQVEAESWLVKLAWNAWLLRGEGGAVCCWGGYTLPLLQGGVR